LSDTARKAAALPEQPRHHLVIPPVASSGVCIADIGTLNSINKKARNYGQRTLWEGKTKTAGIKKPALGGFFGMVDLHDQVSNNVNITA
jgi:hypothetical protein